MTNGLFGAALGISTCITTFNAINVRLEFKDILVCDIESNTKIVYGTNYSLGSQTCHTNKQQYILTLG